MGLFGKPGELKPAAAEPVRPIPTPAPAPQSSAAPAARGPCVVGAKTTIKGELLGDEDVLVEGSVDGLIRISRDLRVGPGGSVKATIEAQSIVVSGEVVGDCVATTRVELHSTGRLTGNIRAPKIVIAEGAMFRGNSDMSSGRKDERKDKLAAS